MSRTSDLAPAAPWVRLETSDSDWDGAEPELLRQIFGELHLIRAFEESVLDLAAAGLVHGPAHSSIGQEGGAVGSVVGLRAGDAINGSHRGHHQFLAKAIGHVAPHLDLDRLVDDAVADVVRRTLAEIMGLAEGWCRGRGGSMHLQWRDAGALGTNAIVGGGVPAAVGSAFAQQRAGDDAVTVTYFGDGAMNIGSTLESLNLAAVWSAPVCFFVENNGYAVATRVDEATREPRLSARGLGFAIPAWQVDGMDPLAVHLAMRQALERLRSGEGPVLVEAEVYRYFHQNGPYPGSAFGYRTKDEEQTWRERDPVTLVESHLLRRGLLDHAAATGVRRQAQEAMTAAVASLVEDTPDGGRQVVSSLWPDPAHVDRGLRGDASELAGVRHDEEATYSGKLAEQRFVDVIATTLGRQMERDERIVILGEDIHRLGGGTNGATKGLAERFPDRVLGTPISENAFAGAAGGMALDGRVRPVVEFMYADFLWVAADQVFNQIGKARHMFGGTHGMPLVLRSKVAMGTGYGSQHSMDPAGIFATAPGWRIVAPSTPFDYVGLMNAALALDDPVVVLEHVDLYTATGLVPVGDADYHIPPGHAAVRREGTDVTVLTYLSMVSETLRAVQDTEVDAEVIDLRWLDRASVDWSTIEASVRKTNAVLIVEQGMRGTGYGAWLADAVQERLFDWLDQPIQRVTGGDAAPSVSQVLERAALASSSDIVDALARAAEGMGR